MTNWLQAINTSYRGCPDACWPSPLPLILCLFILPLSVLLAVASFAYLREEEEEEEEQAAPAPAPDVAFALPELGAAPAVLAGGRMSTAQWFAERFVPCALEVAVRDSIPLCAVAGTPHQTGRCVVCLTAFQAPELLKILPPCQHAFHVPCIHKWFEEHATCPICRCQVTAPASADVRIDVVETNAKLSAVCDGHQI